MVTFYILLQYEKSKWLFNIHEKKNSRVIVRYFQRKSTEGYIFNE